MAMTLYNNDLSPYTARVRMQIHAKGLENEIRIAPRPEGDAYLKIAPTGRVPCLETGMGFNLPESDTIAEFIEDAFPERSLRGHSALGKAKVRLIARYVDTYLQPGMAPLFGQFAANPRDPAIVKQGIEATAQGLEYVEGVIEGPLFALENRLTTADCALIAPLFFANIIGPAFGQDVFKNAPKTKAYFQTISADNSSAQKTVGELAAAVAAFQASQR